MTLPSEEYNAICAATRFLYDLMDPKKTPRVPKHIRAEARRRAKHMPLPVMLMERYREAITTEPGFEGLPPMQSPVE
jgi:hypothetical protein